MGTTTTWYIDADSDGYGDTDTEAATCSVPSGGTTIGGDCDGGDSAIHPAATEVCDDPDNDCDGLVDHADSSLDLSTCGGL